MFYSSDTTPIYQYFYPFPVRFNVVTSLWLAPDNNKVQLVMLVNSVSAITDRLCVCKQKATSTQTCRQKKRKDLRCLATSCNLAVAWLNNSSRIYLGMGLSLAKTLSLDSRVLASCQRLHDAKRWFDGVWYIYVNLIGSEILDNLKEWWLQICRSILQWQQTS